MRMLSGFMLGTTHVWWPALMCFMELMKYAAASCDMPKNNPLYLEMRVRVY